MGISNLIGKAITRFTGKTYAHISPYLLTTCEGGNVALPLYVSIVGASHAINIVTFDMAGTIIAFVIVPVLVAKQSAGDMDLGDLVKKIFSNSFVLAVLFGLLLNLTGIYHMLQNSMFFEILYFFLFVPLKRSTFCIKFKVFVHFVSSMIEHNSSNCDLQCILRCFMM